MKPALILAAAALAACTAGRGTYSEYDGHFSLDTHSEDGLPRGERVSLSPAEMAAAEDAIRRELRDPESAIFRDVMAGQGPGGPLVVCGYVNARNGFGGYVGEEIFIATIANGAVLDFDTREDALRRVTHECRFSGIPI